MKDYLVRLRELLEGAVKRSCEVEVGSIYSSGIDSALLTCIASKHSKVTAYTVGSADSEDVRFSKKSMEDFDFPIKIIEVNESEVEAILPELVRLVGVPDPLKVSVGVPMYFAARAAKVDGLNVVLSGQGGDELFGGYNRYLAHAARKDYSSLQKAMDGDVATAYADNLDRDLIIFKSFGIDLRFPYMDKAFGDYVMSLPYELKVFDVGGKDGEFDCVDVVEGKRFVRKYIQRRLAKELGLPKFLLDRKKKAAQYGSESEKLIMRIAREKGFKKKADAEGRKDFVRMYLESLT